MAFYTRDREAGNKIEGFQTKDEALKAIEEYEEIDKSEGTYEDDFYEICEDDYTSNMPCDNYGMCAGSSCKRFIECRKA